MLKYARSGVTLYLFFDKRRATIAKKYPVKFVVCYRRKRKYYHTGLHLSAAEYASLLYTKKRDLIKVRANIENDYLRLKYNIEALLDKGSFSFDGLNVLMGRSTDKTVSEAFSAKIATLTANGQLGTANTYRGAINSFTAFVGSTITYKDVTVSWLQSYERHMVAQRRSYATVGMYLRALRAIFNEAINAGYVEAAAYPFGSEKKGRYEIPTGSGRKMALPLAQIKQIFEYNDGNKTTQQYLDLWRFSYLCNGANMNDILRLKYGDIVGDELFFLRGKTFRANRNKKEIAVYITPEMRQIIDRWGDKSLSKEKYIFPYLNGKQEADKVKEAKRQKSIIVDVTKRVNKRTKRMSQELGLPEITTYTARHSFATVLKRSGANIAFISESLGHSNLKTTESYLASFETEERQRNARLLTRF